MSAIAENGLNVELPGNTLDFFPLAGKQVREKQAKAIDFAYRMMKRGIRDIIIAAPTGSGKSAIGAALAFWAAQEKISMPGQPGAYYLCTQKLLQDQIEEEVETYRSECKSVISLKTASEYPCPEHGDCCTGLRVKPVCCEFKARACNYANTKVMFTNAQLGVTNYAYFFTERLYQAQLEPRRLIIADECHTLNNQILRFIELTVGPDELKHYAPTIKQVPNMPKLEQFLAWLNSDYRPVLMARLERFADRDDLTPQQAKEMADLESQLQKVDRAMEEAANNRDNWVYWQSENSGELTSIAKPLDAAPFFDVLFGDCGHTRIYMSAYPGNKDVFCRNLGLDPERTAMLSLGSVFPKENRPIHALFIGSMSKKNIENTLPSFLRTVDKILQVHAQEKGVIHTGSYRLGEQIWDYFKGTPHGRRLLFPRKSAERDAIYDKHREVPEPTVILSPSFTEGFDLKDDLARFQIIGKVAWPYLGDLQVLTRKERDPEWYAQEAVSAVVQSTGRGIRHAGDTCRAYLLDSDFAMLYEKYSYMFPKWWTEAVIWNSKHG